MKQRRRPRDSTFLVSAVLAGAGGVLAIAFTVAMPFWTAAHHRPWSSAFAEIAAWGCVALAGCYASIRTYFDSGDPPERPPRGGLPALRLVEGGAAPVEAPRSERDAA